MNIFLDCWCFKNLRQQQWPEREVERVPPVALHFNGRQSPLAPQWPYLIQNVRGSLCLFHLQGPEGHPATALHPAVVVRFVLHLQERATFSFIVIVTPTMAILLRVLKMSEQACCSTHERIFW